MICHVNARSLLSCLDEIKFEVHHKQIDILCISETWLDSSIPDRFVDIEEYKVFRCDSGAGGGVCIYVHKNLKAVKLDLKLNDCLGIESYFIKVQERKLPSFIVGCLYRHPSALAESFDYISEVLQSLNLQNKSFFLLGDMNDDLLNSSNKLDKIFKIQKLQQVIDRPTRITQTSKTLLDVIVTNSPKKIISSEVQPCHFSDHESISTNIDISKPKRKVEEKTFRSLKNYTPDVFCSKLLDSTAELNKILETDNVNKQVEILTRVFQRDLDYCAPITTSVITRPPASWINDEIKSEMKIRDQKRKIRDINFDTYTNEQYKIYKNKVKSLISKSKVEHYTNRFKKCKLDRANIWSVIDDIIPNKKCKNNIICEDPLQTAEKLNNFFASVGKNVFDNIQTELSSANSNHVNRLQISRLVESNCLFRPQPVTVEKVIKTVLSLKTKKSYGHDGISSKFLKDSLPVLAYYLTVIINTSIVTGVFPDEWKHAIVCPSFKQGDIEDPSNYRPISLLPILSKVLEKIVANQLTDYLSENNLLSNTQHGFRKYLSTETALNLVMEKLYSNIDSKKISLITLCDLSKAFDSVSHTILLEKMLNIGIDRFWFENYLKDRTQAVKVKGHVSSKQDVTYGVPQGSVLGPILFNIFINDLHFTTHEGDLIQFADDAQYIHTDNIENIEALVRKVEVNIEKVMDYFMINGLKINASKTKFIFIGTHSYINRLPENIRIKVKSAEIKPSNNVKNLGVTFDSYLNFNSHIEEISKKAMGIVQFIWRNKEYLNDSSRTIVINALVNSLFTYCSTVWGSSSKTNINDLQKIQNFAAKVAVGNGKKFDHATPFIKKLEWLTVGQQIKYRDLLYIFKVLKGCTPKWLLNLSYVSQMSNRESRQSENLHKPLTRTKLADKAFSVRGPSIWNSLPNDIKHLQRFSLFKRAVKSYVKEHM